MTCDHAPSVCIIGLGLIGGSIALDIRNVYPQATIHGIGRSAGNAAKAKDLGLIEKLVTLEQLDTDYDYIIIATPVDIIASISADILNKVGPNTLVIDTGSTKNNICQQLRNHPKRSQFLAAHPIAGTEYSGPEAAIPNLFKNKQNIICESELVEKNLLNKGINLFTSIGLTNTFMSAQQHDYHLACVSHLSHISAFMLSKTVLEQEERHIMKLAGSGFSSTVRLAKSAPNTWMPIFMENKENINQILNEYIINLQDFKKKLQNDQKSDIFEVILKSNEIKHYIKCVVATASG